MISLDISLFSKQSELFILILLTIINGVTILIIHKIKHRDNDNFVTVNHLSLILFNFFVILIIFNLISMITVSLKTKNFPLIPSDWWTALTLLAAMIIGLSAFTFFKMKDLDKIEKKLDSFEKIKDLQKLTIVLNSYLEEDTSSDSNTRILKDIEEMLDNNTINADTVYKLSSKAWQNDRHQLALNLRQMAYEKDPNSQTIKLYFAYYILVNYNKIKQFDSGYLRLVNKTHLDIFLKNFRYGNSHKENRYLLYIYNLLFAISYFHERIQLISEENLNSQFQNEKYKELHIEVMKSIRESSLYCKKNSILFRIILGFELLFAKYSGILDNSEIENEYFFLKMNGWSNVNEIFQGFIRYNVEEDFSIDSFFNMLSINDIVDGLSRNSYNRYTMYDFGLFLKKCKGISNDDWDVYRTTYWLIGRNDTYLDNFFQDKKEGNNFIKRITQRVINEK